MTWEQLCTATFPLVFRRHGQKYYARTPGGELAYGDAQGLYEWRDGQRTDYTCAGLQASSGGRMHSRSPYPGPQQRGIACAVRAWTEGSN